LDELPVKAVMAVMRVIEANRIFTPLHAPRIHFRPY
jgi:hypothetical protein